MNFEELISSLKKYLKIRSENNKNTDMATELLNHNVQKLNLINKLL